MLKFTFQNKITREFESVFAATEEEAVEKFKTKFARSFADWARVKKSAGKDEFIKE